jgi:tetratricopeptide (TPR) repeat protein
VLAFGLAWLGLALLPVSNLIAATGVVVAERTLFLPSAGAMLAVGGGLAAGYAALARRGAGYAGAGLAATAALLLVGALCSSRRQLVWREAPGFFRRLEVDAPDTYRAHLVASMHYAETNRLVDAERAARRSLELYRQDPQVFEQLGQNLRRLGRCREALPVLREAVEHFPDRTIARSRLVECAPTSGDTAEARRVAEDGVRRGQDEFKQTLRRIGEEPR